jgi:glycosyltransferase involved in cell wall biosynthesis
MKVLWFTNTPMPDVNKHFGKNAMGTGGWMGALLELLKSRPELHMGVVTACSHYPQSSFQADGVDYFIVKQKSPRFRRSLFPLDNDPTYLHKCVDIVNTFKPDIVHIHGTERFYAQMMSQGLIQCSVVISIQGIMDACSEWYRWFGKMPFKDILAVSALTSLKFSGLLLEWMEARQQATREREYFRKGKYFFGRTEWDRAYLSYFNNNSRYFEVGEILRHPFWHQQWKLEECKKHRLIFTNTRHPRKGTELLLEAVKTLKPVYPDIELVLIGSLGHGGYARYLQKKINEVGDIVKPLGQITADAIVKELCQAHIFVSASYIDNSPNALAEAQLVGMPLISSYTGGVPSMVEEGKTGLFFPSGDVPLLVSRIKAIFDNDSLARTLGENASQTARKRHDPETIVKAQVAAYSNILQDSNNQQNS